MHLQDVSPLASSMSTLIGNQWYGDMVIWKSIGASGHAKRVHVLCVNSWILYNSFLPDFFEFKNRKHTQKHINKQENPAKTAKKPIMIGVPCSFKCCNIWGAWLAISSQFWQNNILQSTCRKPQQSATKKQFWNENQTKQTSVLFSHKFGSSNCLALRCLTVSKESWFFFNWYPPWN